MSIDPVQVWPGCRWGWAHQTAQIQWNMPSSTLAEDSEMVVISVAMANDFDSIHRAAIFAAVCAAPTAADTAGI